MGYEYKSTKYKEINFHDVSAINSEDIKFKKMLILRIVSKVKFVNLIFRFDYCFVIAFQYNILMLKNFEKNL